MSAPSLLTAAAASAGQHQVAWRKNFSVLVVDDTAAARYALARGLQAAGFSTIEAQGGAAALEFADYASAIVLDVNLPDIDGFEVCRLIRKRAPNIPVIHVSAVHKEDADVRIGNAAGSNAYFVAPVDTGQLAITLDGLLRPHAPDSP
jgi:DNA-binding response OmpR family regulator